MVDHSPTAPQARPGRRTLLCVLDWGLGHASRSLALLHRLEAGGETVVLASSGPARAFLVRECPGRTIHTLPPYRVTYPTRLMEWNVAVQLPRWLTTIWRERRCTAKLVKATGVDRVVSDNRFGCYAPGTPSVFLTHQLHPITGNRLVSALYRRYLQRFDAFWVPDYPAPDRRLSGELSDGRGYRGVHYLGPLSRLTPPARPATPFGTLALLSGPEPMRSRLEQAVLARLAHAAGRHVLVRGLPHGAPPLVGVPANVVVHAFADAALLPDLLAGADRIVCRSGYSTLMDVAAVTDLAKLTLAPTPGQTEQVYLAHRLVERVGCRYWGVDG